MFDHWLGEALCMERLGHSSRLYDIAESAFLVPGDAEFLGSHLTDRLLDQGCTALGRKTQVQMTALLRFRHLHLRIIVATIAAPGLLIFGIEIFAGCHTSACQLILIQRLNPVLASPYWFPHIMRVSGCRERQIRSIQKQLLARDDRLLIVGSGQLYGQHRKNIAAAAGAEVTEALTSQESAKAMQVLDWGIRFKRLTTRRRDHVVDRILNFPKPYVDRSSARNRLIFLGAPYRHSI